MSRTLKLRVVTTIDMEMIVGDEYATGPLAPQERKLIRDKIAADSRERAKEQPGTSVIDVIVKRAFVANR